MNDKTWNALIATLDKARREFAQAMMRRVNYLLNTERSERLDDVQRLDRRIDKQEKRLDNLEERERGDGAGG